MMKKLLHIFSLILFSSTHIFSKIIINSPGDVVKQLWAIAYYGAGWADVVEDIVVDKMGSVFVLGWSQISGDNYDFTTITYSPSGAASLGRKILRCRIKIPLKNL